MNICRNGLSSQPNENYAREVLQLFSIGTFLLNQNGSRQLDGSGNPIPTYDQTTVEEFARVFTGWVLAPNLPGPPESGATTVPNYRDSMVQHKDSSAREDYHDRGTKTLLNAVQLSAGMTADQDLNAAIDNIAYHPNVAPFICKQLIQHLVTSNPSPAYVQRIAAVFTANQTSDTQLFQVVRAILLDSEARGDVKDSTTLPDYGKLREPAQFIPNVLRAFGAASDGVLNLLNVGGSAIGSADMNEDLFNAPSVFNFFPEPIGPPLARQTADNRRLRVQKVDRPAVRVSAQRSDVLREFPPHDVRGADRALRGRSRFCRCAQLVAFTRGDLAGNASKHKECGLECRSLEPAAPRTDGYLPDSDFVSISSAALKGDSQWHSHVENFCVDHSEPLARPLWRSSVSAWFRPLLSQRIIEHWSASFFSAATTAAT